MYRMYNGVEYPNCPDVDNIEKVDMGAMPMILAMTRHGMKIDREHLGKFAVWLKEDMDRVTEEVHEVSGHYINVGSPDQVADLLFNKIGIRPPANLKRTKTDKRYVVDDKTLEGLKATHPVIVMVQDYRERSKLCGTYALPIPRFADSEDRIHPRYKVTRVGSGRLAAEDPNLLAIPTRSKLGKRIREGFIPDKGNVYATIDLSQIEIRVMAHQTGCLNMIETFNRNGDIHTETAMRMFHISDPKKVDKETQRVPAKTTGLGVMYDISAQGLYEQMIIAGAKGWTLEQCEGLIRSWFGLYPEVLVGRRQRHSNALRYGLVWEGFGRVRDVPEVKSIHAWIVSGGKREAGNFPTQSEAQALIKLAMAEIQEELIEQGPYKNVVWALLQVHDELLFECQKSAAADFMEDAQEIMRNVAPFYTVPIESNYVMGENWGKLQK